MARAQYGEEGVLSWVIISHNRFLSLLPPLAVSFVLLFSRPHYYLYTLPDYVVFA